MDAAVAPPVLGLALRGASAAALCLALAEWCHLEHANLAVWTTHMVTAQYAFTAFQKGLERVLGRGLGLVVGLILLTLCRNVPLLGFVLKLVAMLAFFYVYFAGRLAYTFLNAGLYLAAIISIGASDPAAALPQARAMFLAIVLGVGVADLVMWLTGAESDLSIQAGGAELLPLQQGRLGHSLQLVITVMLTQFVSSYLQLPTRAALMSVMVLTITPDIQTLLRKGELRILGAALGTAWALGSFILLSRLPHFVLLEALLFLGMFLAAYLTRASPVYSYAGLQMGLVLPMILVGPPQDFGSIHSGVQRFEGIVAALVVSIVVGSLRLLPARVEMPGRAA